MSTKKKRVKAIEVDVNCVEWLQRMKKDHGVKYGLGHTIRAALELYGCVAAARGSLRPLTTHCMNLRGWEKMPPPAVVDDTKLQAEVSRILGGAEGAQFSALDALGAAGASQLPQVHPHPAGPH